ncbi:hypothetical protein [Streptomyces sp. CB03911]|uniref:hypothetical protein n=1 Tax=Streptomyces sp. CB03911 TaxID=1804758 RepID=UPI00093C2E0B|nr:hypothetical protein [Streptomyces sp. CB03911]OKI15980.1 hypothetical protein A6A07_40905 [Streptomyces sp. CB03911]
MSGVGHVEDRGLRDAVLPVAEDRVGLAVDLVLLQRHLDLEQSGQEGGEQPGHCLCVGDGSGRLRGVAAAVPGRLHVGGLHRCGGRLEFEAGHFA